MLKSEFLNVWKQPKNKLKWTEENNRLEKNLIIKLENYMQVIIYK